MQKHYFAIPIVIGVAAALLTTTYLNKNQNNSDFTLQQLVEMGSPYHGNPASPITIVEFGDYQCTFCYKFHQSSLNVIRQEYIESGKSSLIFIDFPLNGPDSVLAAEASHCAKEQGKFWEFHDEIYKNWKGERTGWVSRDSIDKFASAISLDVSQLNKCIDSDRYSDKVTNTYRFAQEIGIEATPSFFVIHHDKIVKITGNQPIDVFKKTLDEIAT